MRFLKTSVSVILLAASVGAQAVYEVELTFENGATRTVTDLVVQGGKVILAAENLQVPFEQIQSAVFTFEEPLTEEECVVWLKQGAYKKMVTRLDAFLAPVESGLALPGNLDLFVQYKMRAAFWAGDYAKAGATAKLLQGKNSTYAPLSRLYQVLILLEEGKKADEVAQAFKQINSPEKISVPAALFIQGRLAMSARNYDEALQLFSDILVYHGRNPEWVPAASFYEGVVYKRTGYLESVANIASELKIAYPDGYWGRQADELK